MTPPKEPVPAPVKPRDDLRDLRKRLQAVRVTFPGDQVLTNADYAVLGLEPFVSDDFQTEGSSSSANRAGRARTASTARKPRGRPQARRAAPARPAEDDDDDLAREDAPEDAGPRAKAPTAAELLGSMGLGHLLSLREPATRAEPGEAVGSFARSERAESGSSSSRHSQTAGERSGEQSSRSRAPVPSQSAAAAIEANKGERESVEGQQVPGQESVGGGVGAAGGSGQAQPQNRGGSSSEGGGAAAGERTAEQVDQQEALASPTTTNSPPNASTDQQVQAEGATNVGGDEAGGGGNGPEPPPRRKLPPRRRSSRTPAAAPPAPSGSGARSTAESEADESAGGVDESVGGVATRLRPRKRSAAATPAARVTAAPRPPKKKKKGSQATSAKAGTAEREAGGSEAIVEASADVEQTEAQTGIKEEDPSGKAMYLYRDYEKNKEAVMKLFGDGWERAVAHKTAQRHPTRIVFGNRAVSVRYDVPLRKSHASALLRFDATSLEPHVSLAGTDDPAMTANPALGWKETSLDLFTPASVQNLKIAAFDVLEGLGVFWSDKYCKWLPESVWRKHDEERGTMDRFERTDRVRDLIDDRITLRLYSYESTSRMVRTVIKKSGRTYQCCLPLLPSIDVEGPLTVRVKGDDFEIDSEEHHGRLLSSLVGVEGVATLREWREETLRQVA